MEAVTRRRDLVVGGETESHAQRLAAELHGSEPGVISVSVKRAKAYTGMALGDGGSSGGAA